MGPFQTTGFNSSKLFNNTLVQNEHISKFVSLLIWQVIDGRSKKHKLLKKVFCVILYLLLYHIFLAVLCLITCKIWFSLLIQLTQMIGL